MLALTVGVVLIIIALLLAVVAGESRYDHPETYPSVQRMGFLVALAICVLALCAARYL